MAAQASCPKNILAVNELEDHKEIQAMTLPKHCLFVGDTVRLTANFLRKFDMTKATQQLGHDRAVALLRRLKYVTGVIGYIKIPNHTRTAYAWVQWDERTGLVSPWINLIHLQLVP